jgi:hypothetical protein
MLKKHLTVANLLLTLILLKGSLGLYEKWCPDADVSDLRTVISIAIDHLKRRRKSKRD